MEAYGKQTEYPHGEPSQQMQEFSIKMAQDGSNGKIEPSGAAKPRDPNAAEGGRKPSEMQSGIKIRQGRGAMNNKIGQKIYDYRQRHEMSQQQFADIIGVSRSYLVEIENGRRIPGRPTAHKISEVLNGNL